MNTIRSGGFIQMNRKARRLLGKKNNIKIIGTNKPYINLKKVSITK